MNVLKHLNWKGVKILHLATSAPSPSPSPHMTMADEWRKKNYDRKKKKGGMGKGGGGWRRKRVKIWLASPHLNSPPPPFQPKKKSHEPINPFDSHQVINKSSKTENPPPIFTPAAILWRTPKPHHMVSPVKQKRPVLTSSASETWNQNLCNIAAEGLFVLTCLWSCDQRGHKFALRCAHRAQRCPPPPPPLPAGLVFAVLVSVKCQNLA